MIVRTMRNEEKERKKTNKSEKENK